MPQTKRDDPKRSVRRCPECARERLDDGFTICTGPPWGDFVSAPRSHPPTLTEPIQVIEAPAVEELIDVLDGLAAAADQFATEADYEVFISIEERFAGALGRARDTLARFREENHARPD